MPGLLVNPEYDHLHKFFTDLFDCHGFVFDSKYNWAGKPLPMPINSTLSNAGPSAGKAPLYYKNQELNSTYRKFNTNDPSAC